MAIQRHEKREIAFNQIETALRLFFEDGDLFSVVTLAGAAEEILGLLLRQGDRNGHPFRSVLEILRPGNKRAGAQERPAGRETEAFVHLDLRQEALFLLGRAIDDYHALTGGLSTRMLRFDAEVRKKTR